MSKKGKRKEAHAGPPAASDSDDGPATPGGWFRENLEAIVVAVIMALVIRHFCVEAFKIPTSSMEPTLYGNHPAEGIRGDRILVNKFVYRFGEPRRWDVIVFKYPLDKTKNFIKRLVGLPGEEIKILGGNLYVNREAPAAPPKWTIARKPLDVQDAIWQEIFPRCKGEDPGFWGPEEESDLQTREAGFSLKALRGHEAWGAYRGQIHARCDRRSVLRNDPPLSEIRLDFDAVLDGGALKVELDTGESVYLFRVPAGEGEKTSAWIDGKEVAEADFGLGTGKKRRLEFINVDGVLSLRADGRTVLRYEFDPWEHSSQLDRPRLRIGFSGGTRLEADSIALFRDIHYITDSRGILGERNTLRIPKDSFFVLGDNCTSSKDSRLWKVIRFQLKDGTEIVGEASSDSFSKGTGEIHILDTNGVPWHLTRDEVVDFDAREEYHPFVPRDSLIGQAFMVFWPLKRVHLIH